MLVVGLTGGIASGKSTVEKLFAAHGVAVIDADAIARNLVRPGEAGLQAVTQEFGAQVLTAEGCLDRRRMADRVFSDPAARKRLEAILHPLVRDRMSAAVEGMRTQGQHPYVILSVPLLLESNQDDMVDRILVVDLPTELQRRRLLARDQRDEQQISAILRAQIPREDRLSAADDVIDNGGAITDLAPKVDTLHRNYLSLAGHHPTMPKL